MQVIAVAEDFADAYTEAGFDGLGEFFSEKITLANIVLKAMQEQEGGWLRVFEKLTLCGYSPALIAVVARMFEEEEGDSSTNSLQAHAHGVMELIMDPFHGEELEGHMKAAATTH